MAAQRKTLFFPALLVIALTTLIGYKVFRSFHPLTLPQQQLNTSTTLNAPTPPQSANSNVRLIAQVDTSAPSVSTVQTTPVQDTCSPSDLITSPPPQTSNLGETAAACENTGEIDLGNYITPQCLGESCGEFNGTSVTLIQRHEGNVTYSVENAGNGRVIQHSNDNHFVYENDGTNIKLLQDSIWGGGPSPTEEFLCTNGTGGAFYRNYNLDDDSWGLPIYPSKATCGKVTQASGYLKSFPKKWNGNDIRTVANNLASETELGLKACTVAGQTNEENPRVKSSTTTNKLIFQGSAQCMGQAMNMVSFVVTDGPGKGEVTMFAEGKGIVAWYQELDFTKTENNPNQWRNKDLCKLASVSYGNSKQGNLPTYFEYNLQRDYQCKQTPERVLNNFLDEYSVTCMPKSAYMLDLVNKENCGQTAHGCANWNMTGELKLSPGNTLFGLYRDEGAVNERYTSTNNFNQKQPNESIESYFTSNPGEVAGRGRSSKSVDEIIADTAKAPLYGNLTLADQCRLIYHKLAAVKELCEPVNRISGDQNNECAINQYLPNSSTRYLDVLNSMGSADRCDSIVLSDTDLRKQVFQIDPAMEVAYRPAFIVLATLVNDSENINNPFVRAPNTNPANGKFWQLDYLEIKVPSFGSDFLNTETASRISNPDRAGGSYVDPLRAAADALVTPETQKKFQEEEQDERNMIRNAVTEKDLVPTIDGPLKFNGTNSLIGSSDAPVKCRKDKGDYSEGNCDNIARALVSFINASVEMTPKEDSLHRQFTPARGWLPSSEKCDVDENVLYGNVVTGQEPVDGRFPAVEDKYQVSEQALSIGSKLEAQNVGNLNKKKEAFVDLDVLVPDLTRDVQRENISTTRIFFVSPHQYTLMYAQTALMNLLSTDEQIELLQDPNFPNVLKAEKLDTFNSDKVSEKYIDKATNTEFESGVQTQRQKGGDIERESPVLWQTAAHVANLFTRQITLQALRPGDKDYDRTIGCTGPNATELWLKGECTVIPGDTTPDSTTGKENQTTGSASGQCIQVFVNDAAEKQSLAAEIRANLPGQYNPSPRFAGWKAYFRGEKKQHLFFADQCGGQMCYEYILNRIANTNINPQLIIAIALNENGGLRNNDPDDTVGTHFGCGLSGPKFYPNQVIGSKTIQEKLDCVIGFFERNSDRSSDDALRLYGYSNGYRNHNLNKIMGILTRNTYKSVCADEATPQ